MNIANLTNKLLVQYEKLILNLKYYEKLSM